MHTLIVSSAPPCILQHGSEVIRRIIKRKQRNPVFRKLITKGFIN